MAIINLRRYYPHYPKDKFLEVPNEVADALEEGRRIERREDNRRSYYHVYSMDCTPAIENHAMFLVLSPEELLSVTRMQRRRSRSWQIWPLP